MAFKWGCPHVWLEEHIRSLSLTDLLELTVALAWKLDDGTIQEMFEDQMSADGYFEEIEEEG